MIDVDVFSFSLFTNLFSLNHCMTIAQRFTTVALYTYYKVFTCFTAGAVSLSRPIQTETVPGYELQINITDSMNVVGPKTLSVRITGLF